MLVCCAVGGSLAAQEVEVVSAEVLAVADSLEPEAVWSRFEAGEAAPLGDGVFGFSSDWHWVRVEVCGAEEMVLDVRNPHIDRLIAWQLDGQGRLVKVAEAGDDLRPTERTRPNRRPVVSLRGGPGGCATVLMSVDKRFAAVSIPIVALTETEFMSKERRADVLNGGIFAVILLVLGIGGFMFIRLRDRRFASYALYAGVRWVYLFLASGYANMTWLANHPEWTNPLRVAIILPLVFSLVHFAGDFFELRRVRPRWARWNRGMVVGLGLWFLALVVAQNGWGMEVPVVLKIIYALLALSAVYVIALTVGMVRIEPVAARYFSLAFGPSTILGVWLVLEELGWVSIQYPLVSTFMWVSLVEASVLLWGAMVMVIWQMGEQQRLMLKLEEAEGEKMQAYVDGLEEEKRRLASELHDDVSSDLALISYQTGKDAPVTESVQEVMRKIRHLSQDLNPVGVHGKPLSESLQELVDSYGVLPMEVRFVASKAPALQALPPRVQIECYRIVQEALRNVAKHAEAERVFIHLFCDEEEGTLNLTVEDDGEGFDVEAQQASADKSQGINNMGVRAAAIGATFAVDSRRGEGTLLSLVCPLDGDGK